MKYFLLINIIILISIFQCGCDISSLGDDNVGVGHVRGIVFDASTEVRLNNISVSSNINSDTMRTDDKGNFFMLNINLSTNPEDIVLTANDNNYNKVSITTSVHSGDTNYVYIPMVHK